MKTHPIKTKMANPPERLDLYALLAIKAAAVANELRRLNRWQHLPFSSDKFENMGAFGSNTMTFEQWIQFVLVPRIDH
ncbi:MAG TPA: YqcC family protein, partial [Chryseolinea sp.]